MIVRCVDLLYVLAHLVGSNLISLERALTSSIAAEESPALFALRVIENRADDSSHGGVGLIQNPNSTWDI